MSKLKQTILTQYTDIFPLDICIVTYNRLAYLEKCIWSIIASTSVPYRLFIIDDNSDDGTVEWLEHMQKRELIYKVVYNKKNMGTAWNFNHIIDQSKSDIFIMANDDMYFYRDWDLITLNAYNTFNDCGIVSIFNWNREHNVPDVKYMTEEYVLIPKSGLGVAAIKRDLYQDTGKFYLPPGKRMGFFATPFCAKVNASKLKYNKHYGLTPYYALHMDDPWCPLNERKSLEEYSIMRKKYKRWWQGKKGTKI